MSKEERVIEGQGYFKEKAQSSAPIKNDCEKYLAKFADYEKGAFNKYETMEVSEGCSWNPWYTLQKISVVGGRPELAC